MKYPELNNIVETYLDALTQLGKEANRTKIVAVIDLDLFSREKKKQKEIKNLETDIDHLLDTFHNINSEHVKEFWKKLASLADDKGLKPIADVAVQEAFKAFQGYAYLAIKSLSNRASENIERSQFLEVSYRKEELTKLVSLTFSDLYKSWIQKKNILTGESIQID